MKSRLTLYLIIGVIGIVLIIGFTRWNDYREKDLDDVIRYHPNDYTSLSLRDKNGDYEWKTDDKEAIEELAAFISTYRIKKISDRAYDDDLTNDEGFEITINHAKEDKIMALILEDEVHIFKKGYYEVINGPIDMGWVREFNEKYER